MNKQLHGTVVFLVPFKTTKGVQRRQRRSFFGGVFGVRKGTQRTPRTHVMGVPMVRVFFSKGTTTRTLRNFTGCRGLSKRVLLKKKKQDPFGWRVLGSQEETNIFIIIFTGLPRLRTNHMCRCQNSRNCGPWFPRSPSSALFHFFGEGSPTKID